MEDLDPSQIAPVTSCLEAAYARLYAVWELESEASGCWELTPLLPTWTQAWIACKPDLPEPLAMYSGFDVSARDMTTDESSVMGDLLQSEGFLALSRLRFGDHLAFHLGQEISAASLNRTVVRVSYCLPEPPVFRIMTDGEYLPCILSGEAWAPGTWVKLHYFETLVCFAHTLLEPSRRVLEVDHLRQLEHFRAHMNPLFFEARPVGSW